MKKALAVLFLLIFCGTAWSAMYPEIGVCTGKSVRLREKPGSKGRIIGHIEEGRHVFVILGEVYAEGQKWYKIDNPTKKGNAYISAQYVMYGWYGDTPTGADFAGVRLELGIYPEKARAIFGQGRRDRSGNLEYPGLTLKYDNDNMLLEAQISRKGMELMGVKVGDKVEKLLALRMPESEIERAAGMEEGGTEEGWWYENNATGESVWFEFGKNERGEAEVITIIWRRPEGEG